MFTRIAIWCLISTSTIYNAEMKEYEGGRGGWLAFRNLGPIISLSDLFFHGKSSGKNTMFEYPSRVTTSPCAKTPSIIDTNKNIRVKRGRSFPESLFPTGGRGTQPKTSSHHSIRLVGVYVRVNACLLVFFLEGNAEPLHYAVVRALLAKTRRIKAMTPHCTLSSTTITAGRAMISALRMRFATVALLCTIPFQGIFFRVSR